MRNVPPKEKLIEHLVKAYQLLYEAVRARITNELMEKFIKDGGNYGKYQRVQAQ